VQIQIYIGSSSISYSRKSYSLTDVARDIGGLTNVLIIILQTLVYPYAHHSFLLRSIKRLYTAKTRDKNLFAKKKKFSDILKSFFKKEKPETLKITNILNLK